MSATEPRRVWNADSKNVAPLLRKISAQFRAGSTAPRFFGFLGFNAGRAFDPGLARLPLKKHPLKTPAAYFGDYPFVVKVDSEKGQTFLFANGPVAERERLKNKVADLMKIHSHPASALGRFKKGRKLGVAGQKIFTRMVAEAKSAIAAGDIYQANLSLRFSGSFSEDPVDFYHALSERNPSPYSCLLKFEGSWIVSSSPELLVEISGRHVTTRPIAGTRPRAKNRRMDQRRRGQLLLSPKERAEHVMLVDLERNDLGRICRPGSVQVTERYQVERYSHVMHIVSQVEGQLSVRKTSIDALGAVFPGGTITGCPKIRAIELIEKIEGVARGPFYGSAGFFKENGDAMFNILIRTALIKNKKIFIQAGAGIVADSKASREYREIMAKAGALLEVLT